MSASILVRMALEQALDGLAPAIATAWENVPFTPPAQSVPYQIAHVLLAQPDNSEYGSGHQEVGYLQVRLMYPLNSGSRAALDRAEAMRNLFRRGQSFRAHVRDVENWYDYFTEEIEWLDVVISRTPEILPATVEDGRFVVVVRVRFYANVYR